MWQLQGCRGTTLQPQPGGATCKADGDAVLCAQLRGTVQARASWREARGAYHVSRWCRGAVPLWRVRVTLNPKPNPPPGWADLWCGCPHGGWLGECYCLLLRLARTRFPSPDHTGVALQRPPPPPLPLPLTSPAALHPGSPSSRARPTTVPPTSPPTPPPSPLHRPSPNHPLRWRSPQRPCVASQRAQQGQRGKHPPSTVLGPGGVWQQYF